jgi:hypothetical protein
MHNYSILVNLALSNAMWQWWFLTLELVIHLVSIFDISLIGHLVVKAWCRSHDPNDLEKDPAASNPR